MSAPAASLEGECRTSYGIGPRLFLIVLLLLVGGAILRSALATRLDDFHSDEAYHIAAGVSYVRHGDFRLNPEHPPLLKLWAGSLISHTGFRLREFREFHDKGDERAFAALLRGFGLAEASTMDARQSCAVLGALLILTAARKM